jgi:PncC family amidohydrolase
VQDFKSSLSELTDQDLVKEIASVLNNHGKTIATAESCTAGLLGYLLTGAEGSSSYYCGGFSAYSNDVKMNLLNVSQEELARFGAVSSQVAETLSSQCRKIIKSDYAISLTGVAGPGGGTTEKPVGTVWCGISSSLKTTSTLFKLSGNREEIRTKAAREALMCLIEFISSSQCNDNEKV